MKTLIAKLEEVRETTKSLKEDIDKRDKALNTVVENTAKAMPAIEALEKQVSAIALNLCPSPSTQPSVRSKKVPDTNILEKESSMDPKVNESDKVESDVESESNIVEITIRKGLFMTSSIGLKLDVYDLQDKLDSEISNVKTYHIEENVSSKNPDMNLKRNLKQLDGQKDLEFIIIATGTNDISNLDVENESMDELITRACNQSRRLVELASEVAKKHNLDVFVVERPPRGDEDKTYSTANGLFLSLIAPLLHNLPEKSKRNLFTSVGIPVHLKPWGLKYLRNDIIAGVKTVYKDIKSVKDDDTKENVTNEGKRKFQHEARANRFPQDGNNSLHDIDPQKSNDRIPTVSFQPVGRKAYNDAAKQGDQQHNVNRNMNGNNIQPAGTFRNNDSSGGRGQQRNGFRNDGNSFRMDGRGQQRGGGYPQDHSFHNSGDSRNGSNNRQEFRGHGHGNGNGSRGNQSSFNRHGQGNPARHNPDDRRQNNDAGRQNHENDHQDGRMPDMVKQYLLNALMNQK